MSTKEKIVETAAKLILVKGYNHTGLKEILNDAGVPKGSFYYYFKNKEDLALYLLNYYYEYMMNLLNESIEKNNDRPLMAIKEFLHQFTIAFIRKGYTGGCGIGNLGQELSDTDELIRQKADELFVIIEKRIEQQLVKAQEMGLISKDINCYTTAQFIYNSWQGALLRAKIKKSQEPIKIYMDQIFQYILKGVEE